MGDVRVIDPAFGHALMDFSQPEILGRPVLIGRQRLSRTTWILHPLYRADERRLKREVRGHPIPRHIGIILDGNRRHGEKYGLRAPSETYSLGADKLDDVLEWCGELAVSAITLWVFSTDNWARPVLPQSKRRSERSPITRKSIVGGCECRLSANSNCCRHRCARRSVLRPTRPKIMTE